MDFVYALCTMGGLGLLFGIGLFFASRIFHVDVNPRIEKITDSLPGANCGGCGKPGCGALAEAIVHGSSEVGSCPVCSSDQISSIASIMGVEVKTGAREVAVVHCRGRKVKDKYEYDGPGNCAAAQLLIGGPKACSYGCHGLGDCVRACPFGALTLVDGIPEVDEDLCTGCGKCVSVCPRSLIDLQPIDKHVHVLCRSHDKGGVVRKICDVGCIGCKKCEKVCKFDAIHVTGFLAEIDYEKCTSCALCVKECPSGTILNFRKERKARAKKNTEKDSEKDTEKDSEKDSKKEASKCP